MRFVGFIGWRFDKLMSLIFLCFQIKNPFLLFLAPNLKHQNEHLFLKKFYIVVTFTLSYLFGVVLFCFVTSVFETCLCWSVMKVSVGLLLSQYHGEIPAWN